MRGMDGVGDQVAAALGFSFAFFQLAVASLNLLRDKVLSESDTPWPNVLTSLDEACQGQTPSVVPFQIA